MFDVKLGTVQQNLLKQLFGNLLACLIHTSGSLSENVTRSHWSTLMSSGQLNAQK